MAKIKRITALLLCAALLLCVSCTSSDDTQTDAQSTDTAQKLGQTAVSDGKFTLNCSKGYSFNPMTATNMDNQLVCRLVYENMLEVDNVYNLEANVITSWESADGGKTWTFKVGAGHTFHDGSSLTAEDVAYSIQCAMGSERYSARLDDVSSAAADDSETLTVTLTKENMQFPMLLTIPVIEYGTYPQTYPGGSGPYEYASDYNSLIAFEGYAGYATLPLKTIYLAEYSGTEEIISAFTDSSIDLTLNDPSSSTNLGYGSANDIRSYNTTNMHYIILNMYSSDLSNQYVRYALNNAFDREYIVDQLSGYAAAASLPINPVSELYADSVAKELDYDLNAVQKMLSNAGMKDYDGDGFLEFQNGELLTELNLSFLVYNGSAVKVAAAERFADDMKSVGISVTVNKLDWDNYQVALSEGEFDLAYAELRLTADFDLTELLSSGGSMNYGHVASAELNELISAYLAADDSSRAAAAADMCSCIANNAYIIPLCFERHQLITHRGTVEGIKASENNPLYKPENWTVNIESANTEDTTN